MRTSVNLNLVNKKPHTIINGVRFFMLTTFIYKRQLLHLQSIQYSNR